MGAPARGARRRPRQTTPWPEGHPAVSLGNVTIGSGSTAELLAHATPAPRDSCRCLAMVEMRRHVMETPLRRAGPSAPTASPDTAADHAQE